MIALIVSILWLILVSVYAVSAARRSRKSPSENKLTVLAHSIQQRRRDPREFSVFIEKSATELDDSYFRAWKDKLAASHGTQDQPEPKSLLGFTRLVGPKHEPASEYRGTEVIEQEPEERKGIERSQLAKAGLWMKTVH